MGGCRHSGHMPHKRPGPVHLRLVSFSVEFLRSEPIKSAKSAANKHSEKGPSRGEDKERQCARKILLRLCASCGRAPPLGGKKWGGEA